MTDGFGLFARVQPVVFAAAMLPCAYSTAAAATPDATPAPANTPTQTPPSEPSEDDAQRVALVVTVDLSQDEAEVREKVRERTISGLERGGVLVAEDAESTLVVDIRWVRGTTTDYAVSFRLGRGSSDLPEEIEFFRCDGCAGAQLLAQLEQKVSAVVPSELAKKPPPKASTVVMKPEAPQPSTTDSPPKRERRDPNLDAMLYAGFAALFPGVPHLGWCPELDSQQGRRGSSSPSPLGDVGYGDWTHGDRHLASRHSRGPMAGGRGHGAVDALAWWSRALGTLLTPSFQK